MNDVAVAPDGTVLVTDSAAGAVYRIDASRGTVATVVKPDGARGANGIAVTPDGKTAYVVTPIASNSDEHVGILSGLASTLAERTNAERLRTASSVDEVLDLLSPEDEE